MVRQLPVNRGIGTAVKMKILPVDQPALNSIEGWLSPEAQIFTQHIFAFQRENSWNSGVLEMGVFKGKYLSLLAHQVAGSGVPVVGVDAFLQKHGVKLEEIYKQDAHDRIVDAVRSVAGADTTPQLIAGFTNEVGLDELRDLCPAGYSFISVDAGHDSEDVEHDSAMADTLLNEHGVVAFDDIYNPACPGVAEGFIRYMTSGKANLAPFATCGNKVFTCRPSMHARYYDFSKSLARNVKEAAPVLARTLDQLVANEQNDWSPRLIGYEVIPFL